MRTSAISVFFEYVIHTLAIDTKRLNADTLNVPQSILVCLTALSPMMSLVFLVEMLVSVSIQTVGEKVTFISPPAN